MSPHRARTPRPRIARALAGLMVVLLVLALGAATAGAASVQVRSGDTLSGLAARAGVSTQALAAANGITDPDRIVAGTVLRLPGGAAGTDAGASGPGGHTVRPGETLSAIAARHGVPVAALAGANGITDPDRVRAGAVLTIPGGGGASAVAAPAPAGGGGGTVTVRPGETLSAIAARHGVSVAALATANGIGDPDRVVAGSVLRLPGGTGGTGVPRGFTPGRATVARMLNSAALRHGVDARLVRAVAWQESGWDQGAVSHAGAVGVMQLMPATARWLGSDILRRPFDPNAVGDNIDGGVAFLAWLVRNTGSTSLAVAAYYQGLSSVRRIGMYDDTRAYVANVLSLRGRV